jgi:3'(2'), 5'-bisphosphate nucleotidase
MKDSSALLFAIKAAFEAGKAIMPIYNGEVIATYKADASPLTAADEKSNNVIKEMLGDSYPILSEEGRQIDYEERKNWNIFWLIDPLDGTKEFIKKNGEFTVNIALIENGVPVLGVVYLPAKGHLYFGTKDVGSFMYALDYETNDPDIGDIIATSNKIGDDLHNDTYTIVASRSHMSPETESFIAGKKHAHGDVKLISSGSSIKLCLVAEGKANVYPRLAPTMEWDTAAAHAVAKFAGCKVYNYETGNELQYNKENLLNPWFVVERN